MAQTIETDTDNNPSEARSRRIKYLRKKLGLTQQDMEDKYQIPVKSLQNWERVRYSGLSEKSAERLAQAFIQEGIQCDLTRLITWMLYGDGPDPTTISTTNSADSNLSNEAKIAEELKLFHSLHLDAIDATVMDNSLAPWLNPGDRVAGIRYAKDTIDKALGYPSIVKTQSGEILIRIIEKSNKPDHYSLISNNLETPKIQHIQVVFAAPIIWIRKHLPN